MFTPQAGVLLDSYKETQTESNHLFHIPKIFCVDSCRGKTKARITETDPRKIEELKKKDAEYALNAKKAAEAEKAAKAQTQSQKQQNQQQHHQQTPQTSSGHKIEQNKDCDKQRVQETQQEEKSKPPQKMVDVERDEQKQIQTIPAKKQKMEEKKDDLAHDQLKQQQNREKQKNADKNEKGKEKYNLKTISKEQAQTLAAQDANFCKLYGNVDGYAVADGSENGGLFLRNVVKLFGDKKFILKHDWTNIMYKIREYTKREASSIGLENFTQMVENEGTLERIVKFYPNGSTDYSNINENKNESKYDNANDSNVDNNNNNNNDEEAGMSCTVTNLSVCDEIAILIDQEKVDYDRDNLIQSLISNNLTISDKLQLFATNGFVLIKPNGEYKKFYKVWESVGITAININKNEVICESEEFDDNYLYYFNDVLCKLQYMKPKCQYNSNSNNKNGIKHKLTKQRNGKHYQCKKCQTKNTNVHYFCHKCKYSLCEHCTHNSLSAIKLRRMKKMGL